MFIIFQKELLPSLLLFSLILPSAHAQRLQVDGSVQQPIAQVKLENLIQDNYAILQNSNDPNYQQMLSDYQSGLGLYNSIVGQPQASPPSAPPTQFNAQASHLPVEPILPIIPIQPLPPAPTPAPPRNYQEVGAMLEQNANLPLNAKLFFLSLALGKLDRLWTNNPYVSVPLETTLQYEFNALVNNTPAGLCGPIHTFGAYMAMKLGFNTVGMLGTDWSNVGHAVMFVRDPGSRTFIWINYDDVTETKSEYLTEAALEEGLNLNPLSASTTVESGTATGHVSEHEMQSGRFTNFVNRVHQVTTPDQPGVKLEAGSLENTATVQKRVVGTDDHKVTVFALAHENREQNAYQVGVAGVGVTLKKEVQVSHRVSGTAQSDTEVGVIGVHDHAPAPSTFLTPASRVETGLLGTSRNQVNVVYTGDKNKVKVGAEGNIDELEYGLKPKNMLSGAPYTKIRGSVSVEHGKNLEVHAKSDSFLYTNTLQDQRITLHPLAQNAGVTVSHSNDQGNLKVSNSTDVYSFGSITSGALGVRNITQGSFEDKHHVIYGVKGEFAKNINHSGEIYNDYATTGLLGGSVYKQFKRFSLTGAVESNLNSHAIFNQMSEGSLDQSDAVNRSRLKSGVKIGF